MGTAIDIHKEMESKQKHWLENGQYITDPRAGRLRLPWKELSVGDWFPVNRISATIEQNIRMGASTAGKRNGKRFSCHKNGPWIVVTRES